MTREEQEKDLAEVIMEMWTAKIEQWKCGQQKLNNGMGRGEKEKNMAEITVRM